MRAHEIDFETDSGRRVRGVGCCFCDEHIEPTQIDPMTVHLIANDERSQVLWAHSRCLVAARISDLRYDFYGEGADEL